MGKNIFILRKGITSKTEAAEFYYMGIEEKTQLIADYFFYLRNKYTHTVDHIETHEDDQTYLFKPPWDDSNEYSIVIRAHYKHGDQNKPVEWTIGTRSSITESDIARLVLVVQLRQKILGIKDDETFLNTYLDRILYSYLGYQFLEELELNLKTIKEWRLKHLSHEMYRPGGRRIAPIDHKFTDSFILLHNKIYPHLRAEFCPSLSKQQPSLHQAYYPDVPNVNLGEYIGLVNEFNRYIEKDIDDDQYSIFFNSRDVIRLCSYIECIERDLSKILNEIFY